MAKLRKPLAPPTRPHSPRVKPEPEIVECEKCGDTGVVRLTHLPSVARTYVQCPVCTPEHKKL